MAPAKCSLAPPLLFQKAFLQVNCFLTEVVFNLEKRQKSQRPSRDSRQDTEQVVCLFLGKKTLIYTGGTSNNHRHRGTENFQYPISDHFLNTA